MRDLGTDENKNNEGGLSPELRKNPFSVPDSYFSTLKNNTLFSKSIHTLSDSVFSTPADYQTQLTNSIIERVEEEKLKARINEDGFIVPNGYFHNLQKEIISQTVSEPKVISIKKSKTAWMSYAAAACIAILISLFALFPQKSNENSIANMSSGIDALPTEEIIDYLAFYSETGDLTTLSNQLSEEPAIFTNSFSSDEIESYLENSI